MAVPVSSSCPCSCIISLHLILSWTPESEWIILSIQEWQGCQHPRSALLAALTMASQRSVVISPCQSVILGSSSDTGRLSASTIPLLRTSSDRYSSCTFKNSCEAGYGGRTLNSERRRFHCSFSVTGILIS